MSSSRGTDKDHIDDALDDLLRFNRLFDIYGATLTNRQRDIARLRFERDLSLGEIAEGMGITRQAAHDTVKQAKKRLENIERQLGVLRRGEIENARRAKWRERVRRELTETFAPLLDNGALDGKIRRRLVRRQEILVALIDEAATGNTDLEESNER